MHDSAYKDAQTFADKYIKDDFLTIVDIGSCDVNGTLKPIFDNIKWKYIGCDISPGPNVDIVLSQDYYWPEIKTDSCDIVVSTQVIEHVRHPWRWIKEIARICAPNGFVYLCVPNTIVFHEYPIDCWRVWPDGMKALFDEAKLMPLEVYTSPGAGLIGDTTGIATKISHLLI